MDIVWFLLIGLAAGWLAGRFTKTRGSGPLALMGLGILGAVLGGWVFRLLGMAPTNRIGILLTATVGAVLVLWFMSFFRRAKG